MWLISWTLQNNVMRKIIQSLLFGTLFNLGLVQTGLVSGQNISVPTSVIRVVEGKINFNSLRGGGFPIVDGKLDDGCWEKASRISGFNGVEGRRQEVDQQTEVYLIYNDQETWHGKGSIRLYLRSSSDSATLSRRFYFYQICRE